MELSVFTDELALDVNEALSLIKDWGSRYVDFRGAINGKGIEYQTTEELKALKKRLADLGLKIGAFESSLGKVNLPDRERRKQEEEKLEGLIRAADVLGCNRTRSFNYWQHDEKPGDQTLAEKPEVLNQVLDLFSPIAKRAAAAGLELSFEDCGQTMEEVIAFVDALKIPGWGLAFDPFNELYRNINIDEVPDFYKKGFEYANQFHVKYLSIPGTPDIKGRHVMGWEKILKMAAASKRDVLISVETHNPKDSPVSNLDASRQAFEYIRKCWPSVK
jgi:sugar phosphate isomerase/epimerase